MYEKSTYIPSVIRNDRNETFQSQFDTLHNLISTKDTHYWGATTHRYELLDRNYTIWHSLSAARHQSN